MSKQEVLDLINKGIKEEYGDPVTINDKVVDSNLDSLGMALFIMQLDAKFGILKDKPLDYDEFSYIGLPDLTVRGLVAQCISSSTN